VPSDVKFKLMAVNAIYFFGSWVIPFNKTFTSPERFTTPDGKTMQVGQTDTCRAWLLPCDAVCDVAAGGWFLVLKNIPQSNSAHLRLPDDSGAADALVSAGKAPHHTANSSPCP
jgi:hypothetical protein